MELNEKYKIIKKMLDKKFSIDVISKNVGLSETEILDFLNGEYKYIKNEEKMQSLSQYFNGEPVIRTSIYDNETRSKTR